VPFHAQALKGIDNSRLQGICGVIGCDRSTNPVSQVQIRGANRDALSARGVLHSGAGTHRGHRAGDRRPAVHDGVLAEQNGFAWSVCGGQDSPPWDAHPR
jgi:hypothetical protein